MPAGVFVDPELAQSPELLTERAINSMLRLKILEQTGNRLALAAVRKHPNYPKVDDIVAFQARFIGETLAAAAALSASERQ